MVKGPGFKVESKRPANSDLIPGVLQIKINHYLLKENVLYIDANNV